MLNIADKKVSQIEVVECHEPLVALAGLHRRLYVDDSIENRNHLGYIPNFQVRETVANKLLQALDALPVDFSLLVKESLRPASIQESFFNRRLVRFSAENPLLSRDQLIEMTARFIAPPWVGGHPSGGAIDITLCDAKRRELDLGCGYDQDEQASGGACISDYSGLGAAARKHRTILFTALTNVGLVNYPFEWWHWSYGDRYWAALAQMPYAIYGPVAL